MRILCVGGGTMGSVTPLLAVVDELRRERPGCEIRWIGTQNGAERALIEADHIPFAAIVAGKFRRYFSLSNVTDVLRIFVGWVQALQYLGTWRPDVVLTAGSFVAVPVGWAAWIYRVPIMVHQLDVRPGLANKLLTCSAARITVTFQQSLQHFPSSKAVVTGNPVRGSFFSPPTKVDSCRQLELDPTVPVLTVVGGGTGSDFINKLVERNVTALSGFAQIIHVTGRGKIVTVKASDRYKAYTFNLNTLPLLQAADVVVTRAGMMFLSELAVLGKAALCIPLPGHQEENAAYLAQAQAAVVMAQTHLTDEVFIDTVRKLLMDGSGREKLARTLQSVFPVSAASAVAREVLAVLESRTT